MSKQIHKQHIRWAFNISNWRPTLDELRFATTCIQLEEKQRLARFVFRNDFNASLIGRLLMRKFVNEATNMEYDSIQFERDSKGKPYIILPNKNQNLLVDFNVSHQGSYSVLAGFIQSTEQIHSSDNNGNNKSKVGVDIMKIEYTGGKTLDEFFRIMTRNFSPLEWISIKNKNGTSDREKLKTFMRHWCLKESYVKNIGVGITIDLQKISFNPQEPLQLNHIVTSTTLDIDGIRQPNWRFEESLLDNDHIVAVAYEEDIILNTSTIPFETLTFNQLMSHAKPLLPPDETYCKEILAKEYKN